MKWGYLALYKQAKTDHTGALRSVNCFSLFFILCGGV